MKINAISFHGNAATINNEGGAPVLVYEIAQQNRDENNLQQLQLSDDKTLEIAYSDGTRWICDAYTLHEIFPEAIENTNKRDGAADSFHLPLQLDASGEERGLAGKIVMKLLKVFTKKAAQKGVSTLAENLEDKHLLLGIGDNPAFSTQWKNAMLGKGAALLKIESNFSLSPKIAIDADKPVLLFIHGTNSDTIGAFSALAGTKQWQDICNSYGDNILAFQHRTLTHSPLTNIANLATLLPGKCTLHLVSHSRGGLVGDVLCRFVIPAMDGNVGFGNQNIQLLTKEERVADLEQIKVIAGLQLHKNYRVEKFVRVASPGAGTVLASKRLDTIFNTLGNVLTLVDNPFTEILAELTRAVVATKDDVSVLPGIEAMNPASPFIKVLNDQLAANAVPGNHLMVIAANSKAGFSLGGLVIVLLRLFYQQRNDLVVNTDSMYLGVARSGNIQYFFDEHKTANHVSYFANGSTREALQLALQTPINTPIPGYKKVPQLQVQESDRGLEYGELFPAAHPPSGKKPIVVLLPGIMGSNLYVNGKRRWINYWHFLTGGLASLHYESSSNIAAESLVKTSYKKLHDRLEALYDVVVYPFDWRQPLTKTAELFNDKMEELMQYNQPIKIIGHSMGGVLVRDFIVQHHSTWQRLKDSKDFRLLFLGSPLGGSHRILTVLFGQDDIINKLNMIDRVHSKKELVEIFRRFPGILSLLPLSTDGSSNFADTAVWEKMRAAAGDVNWPIPDAKELLRFQQYRDKILAASPGIDYSRMVYLAGQDDSTPCDYYLDEIPPRKELVFLYTAQGDQSVTWASGIPQQLINGGQVYYAAVSHGALANEPDLFDAIEDLLETGKTTRLPIQPPATAKRGATTASKPAVAKPVYDFDFSENGLLESLLGTRLKKTSKPSRLPIEVTVSNGDLAYASYPVLAGHFLNDGILYAEKAIDNNLGGRLTELHQLGTYPGNTGTHEVLISHSNTETFAGAIIAGLGEAGMLTGFALAKTVEQAVCRYLLQLGDKPVATKKVGISALLIGSGFGGLSADSSVRAIVEGINNANARVSQLFDKKVQQVQHIEFVELYRYRAVSCMNTLLNIVKNENTAYNVFCSTRRIKELLGLKKRMPIDAEADWWHRISVKYFAATENEGNESRLVFSANTGLAREEEQVLYASTNLIDVFIQEISANNSWNGEAAKTLFELMIPNAFKDRLKQKGNICWVLDEDTAAYPWELLQDSVTETKPICINAGMIRQLATKEYRTTVKRMMQNKALIIADPLLKDFLNQLPGARQEGELVHQTLQARSFESKAIIAGEARAIATAMCSDSYKILHLAGHGLYNEKSLKQSGMVIGHNSFLSVASIEQMTVVPELVFINCCHLGKVNASLEKYYQDRYKLAATLGTQLIKMGAKAVIAAGWAVDDVAACEFAETFYQQMLSGCSFGLAVQRARTDIYEKYGNRSNTWGAYQCYGDPFYKLDLGMREPNASDNGYIVPEQAESSLENLLSKIETGRSTKRESIQELQWIKAAIDNEKFKQARLIELQARILLELREEAAALDCFRKLLEIPVAEFAFSSMELYCVARVRYCLCQYFFEKKISRTEAIAEVAAVIHQITTLKMVGKTTVRLNMLGSAYKRLAMLETQPKKANEAIVQSAICYHEAFVLAKQQGSDEAFYPAVNAIKMHQLIVYKKINVTGVAGIDIAQFGNPKVALALVKQLQQVLQKTDAKPDYWFMSSMAGLQLSSLLLDDKRNNTDAAWEQLTDTFANVWGKAGSDRKKATQYEEFQYYTNLLKSITGKYTPTLIDLYLMSHQIDRVVISNQLTELRKAWGEVQAGEAPPPAAIGVRRKIKK
jgi:CHAT domain-containing protein